MPERMRQLFCSLFLFMSLMTFAQTATDSTFLATAIPDSVWTRMRGKTYHQNAYIQRSDLRYLRLHYVDFEGEERVGEMVCNRAIAADLLDIFRQLYEARYPIERIQLPDDFDADDERQMRANNTSCFCFRVIKGSTKLSAHAQGLAVDLNPLYNPCVKTRRDGTLFIQPSTAAPYVDRSRRFAHKIDRQDLAYRLFIQHGFSWGGAWRSSKDYQHFEKDK